MRSLVRRSSWPQPEKHSNRHIARVWGAARRRSDMSEETFRWVITAGVAASWLAITVGAFAMVGLYRASKKTQEKVEQLILKVEPILQKAGPMIDSARALVEASQPKIAVVLARAN